MTVSSWLRNEPTPDVQLLTLTELLKLWSRERNTMLGVICADEVCRRLLETEKRKTH